MGACSCNCDTGLVESFNLSSSWSNERIFGLEGYNELGEEDCADSFKNTHELKASLSVTKGSLTRFFKNQMKSLPALDTKKSFQPVNIYR